MYFYLARKLSAKSLASETMAEVDNHDYAGNVSANVFRTTRQEPNSNNMNNSSNNHRATSRVGDSRRRKDTGHTTTTDNPTRRNVEHNNNNNVGIPPPPSLADNVNYIRSSFVYKPPTQIFVDPPEVAAGSSPNNSPSTASQQDVFSDEFFLPSTKPKEEGKKKDRDGGHKQHARPPTEAPTVASSKKTNTYPPITTTTTTKRTLLRPPSQGITDVDRRRRDLSQISLGDDDFPIFDHMTSDHKLPPITTTTTKRPLLRPPSKGVTEVDVDRHRRALSMALGDEDFPIFDNSVNDVLGDFSISLREQDDIDFVSPVGVSDFPGVDIRKSATSTTRGHKQKDKKDHHHHDKKKKKKDTKDKTKEKANLSALQKAKKGVKGLKRLRKLMGGSDVPTSDASVAATEALEKAALVQENQAKIDHLKQEQDRQQRFQPQERPTKPQQNEQQLQPQLQMQRQPEPPSPPFKANNRKMMSITPRGRRQQQYLQQQESQATSATSFMSKSTITSLGAASNATTLSRATAPAALAGSPKKSPIRSPGRFVHSINNLSPRRAGIQRLRNLVAPLTSSSSPKKNAFRRVDSSTSLDLHLPMVPNLHGNLTAGNESQSVLSSGMSASNKSAPSTASHRSKKTKKKSSKHPSKKHTSTRNQRKPSIEETAPPPPPPTTATKPCLTASTTSTATTASSGISSMLARMYKEATAGESGSCLGESQSSISLPDLKPFEHPGENSVAHLTLPSPSTLLQSSKTEAGVNQASSSSLDIMQPQQSSSSSLSLNLSSSEHENQQQLQQQQQQQRPSSSCILDSLFLDTVHEAQYETSFSSSDVTSRHTMSTSTNKSSQSPNSKAGSLHRLHQSLSSSYTTTSNSIVSIPEDGIVAGSLGGISTPEELMDPQQQQEKNEGKEKQQERGQHDMMSNSSKCHNSYNSLEERHDLDDSSNDNVAQRGRRSLGRMDSIDMSQSRRGEDMPNRRPDRPRSQSPDTNRSSSTRASTMMSESVTGGSHSLSLNDLFLGKSMDRYRDYAAVDEEPLYDAPFDHLLQKQQHRNHRKHNGEHGRLGHSPAHHNRYGHDGYYPSMSNTYHGPQGLGYHQGMHMSQPHLGGHLEPWWMQYGHPPLYLDPRSHFGGQDQFSGHWNMHHHLYGQSFVERHHSHGSRDTSLRRRRHSIGSGHTRESIIDEISAALAQEIKANMCYHCGQIITRCRCASFSDSIDRIAGDRTTSSRCLYQHSITSGSSRDPSSRTFPRDLDDRLSESQRKSQVSLFDTFGIEPGFHEVQGKTKPHASLFDSTFGMKHIEPKFPSVQPKQKPNDRGQLGQAGRSIDNTRHSGRRPVLSSVPLYCRPQGLEVNDYVYRSNAQRLAVGPNRRGRSLGVYPHGTMDKNGAGADDSASRRGPAYGTMAPIRTLTAEEMRRAYDDGSVRYPRRFSFGGTSNQTQRSSSIGTRGDDDSTSLHSFAIS